MDYITVTTPENIEIEYRLAGAGSRLAAIVIDFAVLLTVFALLAVFTFFAVFGYSFSDLLSLNLSGWFIAFIIITYFILYFGYFIAGEIFMNGQTLGKKLFKLRVIRENGMPVGFIQSFIRNLIRYFIDFTGVGLIVILFSKKCKRLGDMAASTIVVSDDPSQIALTSITADSLMKGTEYQYVYDMDSSIQLSADERYLINEFFERKRIFLDGGKGLEKKIQEYISKKYEVPINSVDIEKLAGMK